MKTIAGGCSTGGSTDYMCMLDLVGGLTGNLRDMNSYYWVDHERTVFTRSLSLDPIF